MSNLDWKLKIITPPDWAKDTVSGMYLFGSRSMAIRDGYKSIRDSGFDVKEKIASRIGPFTDFDYAAPNSYKLRDRLSEDGWKEIDVAELYHPDPIMKGLYIKERDGQSVQILLRSNHEMFRSMWESIDPEFWYRYIWKSSPEFYLGFLDTKQRKEHINNMIGYAYNVTNKVYQWT